ncbi:elongation factor G [Candidatus Fermentibacteria bacterium]|nr:MAG: elongation factor G [Candidatus Fermentibacteria bacterium]
MKNYTPEKLRNVVVLGHGSVGKTSFCDAMLFTGGGCERLGSVDDGTSVFDYTAESREKKHSFGSSIANCQWKGHKVNIIDTPGLADFYGETIGALSAAEMAVLLIDCTDGVEVGSFKTWKFAADANIPVFVYVNRIDRENADFDRVIEQAREMFNKHAVPVAFPIMEGESFKGIANVITGKAVDTQGNEMPLPDSAKDKCEEYRMMLIEEAAEADEELMESFFANETLTDDELSRGISIAVKNRGLFPIFCGTSLPPAGQSFVMDSVVEYGPSPLEAGPVNAVEGDSVSPEPSGGFVARAFSTKLDKHVGDMVYIKVLRGGASGSHEVINTGRSQSERLGNYYYMNGASRQDTDKMVTGDIIAVAKLKNTITNDVLCDKSHQVKLEPIDFPNPVYRAAIVPTKRGDEDKMGAGLHKLGAMDPTFITRNEANIGQTTVSGMGELHLQTMLTRLKDMNGVDTELLKPRIAYQETITKTAAGAYKHKKQSGGRGQYGHVIMRIEPLPRGEGFEFASEVTGGNVPTKYIPAVEKGVVESMHKGPISGSEVIDIKAVVTDGSSHSVDSSDMAFKLAASKCFQDLMMQAGPVLLEPLMLLEITVPDEFMGDVMGDVNTRRGKIQGMEAQGGFQVIKAIVPEAELYQYTSSLRSLTQARGSFTQAFSHYEAAPRDVQQKVMEEYQKDEE